MTKKEKFIFALKAIFAGVLIGQFAQPLPFVWDNQPIEKAVDAFKMAEAYGFEYLAENEKSTDQIISLAEGE